jgi:uncharacterized protein DUF2865
VLASGRAGLSIWLVCVAAVTACSPASAQGLLELFFGARPVPVAAPPATPVTPAPPASPASPASLASLASPASQVSTGSIPVVSTPASSAPRQAAIYCVRLCDGRFFPIQPVKAASPAQLCTALCPASPTKIFHGSEIKHAVAADGTRYGALANAFAYRDRVAPLHLQRQRSLRVGSRRDRRRSDAAGGGHGGDAQWGFGAGQIGDCPYPRHAQYGFVLLKGLSAVASRRRG